MFIRLLFSLLFGAYCGIIGLTIYTPHYWVLFGLFIGYGMACDANVRFKG